ncbi:Phospholipid/glycerol acyltransferase domain-containing protein [Caenorhabditis elegans]|uniref:Dihydroxyacetone phosphate acyltransferase n=1 Tax=Caenorhabditis elegans TaxID=6239 RepID=G5EFP8_CAEEL|nr:Phospholipid/glycerol acyltransferase domain-containing protein [Caenorhabditis elegans]CAB60363.2 Phospholipid/glycerol acyltransferase domain-containing protein [Caenorhabditis elegans]CAC92449.1 dihydroxyacetone phosphate acyltransferase [Caenorhabditis elegans]|eukprot:NP_496725.2 ACyLtransferase-like [Caenorhabditis elegans]
MTSASQTGRQINYPEYENFLEHLKNKGGPFKFVTATKNFPVGSKVGTAPKTRSLAEIRKSVLESPRVKSVISEETLRRKCSPDLVRKEAEEILDEMSHTFNLYNVRSFGYAVCKAMEKLYDGIYVNEKKLLEIRERSKKDCVIFMPSHKTYFDFLLLSLICFQYDIQLPAIAAGQDFMSMKFMAGVLRRSGAFFMRRSFGTDQLYWAVFSEYVQTHVVNNDRTVEFFVEATRSRVGKSLHPKYGMLQMVLEPYLRGSVYDIVIVPVSMNYDKILEEKLYAYELLGFPKPKESTGALLKAREMLKITHGSCFLTFGEPISVRDHFGVSLHRNTFVCQPDSQFVLDAQAKLEIKRFAHRVVGIHNQNAVITVWSVACMAILQTFDRDDQAIITYCGLYTDVNNLIILQNHLGTVVNIQGNLDKNLRYYLTMHADLFEPFEGSAPDFQLKFIAFPVAHQKQDVPIKIMERAVSRLILTTYSNGMVHAVDSEGIICTILRNSGITDVAKVKEEFCWLHFLMKREFVTVPGELPQLFDATLDILRASEILQFTDDNKIEILDEKNAEVLSKLVLPYFYNFEIAFNVFSEKKPMVSSLSEMVGTVQKNISEAYQDRLPNIRLSFLSTEPIKNAFAALTDFGVFENSNTGMRPNFGKLHQIKNRLQRFTQSENHLAKL